MKNPPFYWEVEFLCFVGMNIEIIYTKSFHDFLRIVFIIHLRLGAITGSIVSSKVYENFNGDKVLLTDLCLIFLAIILAPSCWRAYQLYMLFFILGFCAANNDTGCTFLTRKLRGKEAGPWLAANGISFGMAAAIVPIIESLSTHFATQYYLLSCVIVLVAVSIIYGMQSIYSGMNVQQCMSKLDDIDLKKSRERIKIDEIAPHYYVEYFVAFTMFTMIGGSISFMAFITDYVNQTNVGIAKNHVVSMFWISASIGRIIGLIDQRYYIQNDEILIRHLAFLSLSATMFILLILLFPTSPVCFWIGLIGYSTKTGPIVAYCLDLNNRLTLPTEKSTSICFFGITAGSSIFPYLISLLWKYNNNNPCVLMICVMLSALIPLPLILSVKSFSYKKTMPEPLFLMKRADSFYETDSVQISRFKTAVNVIMGVNRIKNLTNKMSGSMKDNIQDDNSNINEKVTLLEGHERDKLNYESII